MTPFNKEAFEAWATSVGLDVTIHPMFGIYTDRNTSDASKRWKETLIEGVPFHRIPASVAAHKWATEKK